jgi:hypothetical protein
MTPGKKTTSKAISKTKALATRRKPKALVVPTSSGGTKDDTSKPNQVLLTKLMEQHMLESGLVSFASIMTSLDMNDRNTKWRIAWKDLQEQDYTEQATEGGFFTSGFNLTKAGLDMAATDEYKEAMAQMKTTPKTNEEHHARIKRKLMNKRGDQIFDLLLQHGRLSRKELASILEISDRGAYFSYALQQLKDLGYAENVPDAGSGRKKVRLTDKAFVGPREEYEDSNTSGRDGD